MAWYMAGTSLETGLVHRSDRGSDRTDVPVQVPRAVHGDFGAMYLCRYIAGLWAGVAEAGQLLVPWLWAGTLLGVREHSTGPPHRTGPLRQFASLIGALRGPGHREHRRRTAWPDVPVRRPALRGPERFHGHERRERMRPGVRIGLKSGELPMVVLRSREAGMVVLGHLPRIIGRRIAVSQWPRCTLMAELLKIL